MRNNRFSFGDGEYSTGVRSYLTPGGGSDNDSRFMLTAQNNVFDLLGNGIKTSIYLYDDESLTHRSNIDGNQFSQLHGDGYRLEIAGGDDDDGYYRELDSEVRVADNLMTRSFGNLVDIQRERGPRRSV